MGSSVMLRSIDLIGATAAAPTLQDNPYSVLSRSKALMWEAGVVDVNSKDKDTDADAAAGGAIVVSGLNVLMNPFTSGSRGAAFPEAAWLLHSMLQYAYTAPKPSAKMHLKITECPGCLPPQNVNLCPAT